jgi:ATP sulfurylase
MEEQLIKLELAKLAKEKGFKNGIHHNGLGQYYTNTTQSLLQKWLRDNYGIKIVIIPTFSCYNFEIMKYNKGEDENDVITPEGLNLKDFTKYEETLEFALQESLKLI